MAATPASSTFTSTVKGVTVNQKIPVSLTLTAHKPWVFDNGVALVSTPSASKLTHTVKVKDGAASARALDFRLQPAMALGDCQRR